MFILAVGLYLSWTIKKVERQRIDAFELWCWRILESPLDCKEIQTVHPKGNQSWIFIGRTDAEASASILWPMMQTTDSFENTLMLGKIEDRRRRGRQRMRWFDMASPTQWTCFWVNSGSWWWTGRPGMLQSVGSQRVGHNWVTELNWYLLFSVPGSSFFQIYTWLASCYYLYLSLNLTSSDKAWLPCLKEPLSPGDFHFYCLDGFFHGIFHLLNLSYLQFFDSIPISLHKSVSFMRLVILLVWFICAHILLMFTMSPTITVCWMNA